MSERGLPQCCKDQSTTWLTTFSLRILNEFLSMRPRTELDSDTGLQSVSSRPVWQKDTLSDTSFPLGTKCPCRDFSRADSGRIQCFDALLRAWGALSCS